MIIDLNKHRDEIFNPLIGTLQKSDKRFVINYGGAGSGKSYTNPTRNNQVLTKTREITCYS